jgi:peptidoglycan hydrolase-like protein with peptidoglycan-binding domain
MWTRRESRSVSFGGEVRGSKGEFLTMTNRRTCTLFAAVVMLMGLTLAPALADEHDKSERLSAGTVKKVQTELKEKGHYTGEVDGVMGVQTRTALRHYQQEKGLAGDGRLTRQTARELGVIKTESDSPGEHFEEAGSEIKKHYGEGGKDLGRGGKEAGKDVKEGEVGEAAKDVGKGAGKFGKKIGKGTGKGAKKVGEGVKDAFDGDDGDKDKDKEKKRKESQPD